MARWALMTAQRQAAAMLVAPVARIAVSLCQLRRAAHHGDNKHPCEVGCAYFALEEEEVGKRFVVRHVGVHDFGG